MAINELDGLTFSGPWLVITIVGHVLHNPLYYMYMYASSYLVCNIYNMLLFFYAVSLIAL